MEISIVANNHRPALVTDYLTDIGYRLNITPDYASPDAPYDWLSVNPTGAYRCFRGHQNALRNINESPVLIMEDDAAPNRRDWISIVQRCIPMLDRFEVVSLHGRDIEGIAEKITCDDLTFLTLNEVDRIVWGRQYRTRWCLGSLAYLVAPQTAAKIVSAKWDGTPMDLFLANRFTFCVIEQSPFDHNRKYKSLVDTYDPAKRTL